MLECVDVVVCMVVCMMVRGHYVAVYKALEQRHADLAMRFLNINDERSIDTASDLINTVQYIPTMLKHSLGIMCALTDYTHKNWSATDTKKE